MEASAAWIALTTAGLASVALTTTTVTFLDRIDVVGDGVRSSINNNVDTGSNSHGIDGSVNDNGICNVDVSGYSRCCRHTKKITIIIRILMAKAWLALA